MVGFFKAGGKGQITRMQAVLRAYVDARKRRAVETGPDGFLDLLTDESDGALYRLEPAAGWDPA